MAGTPLKLEPWQTFYFGNLFGWYRKDGTRRFRSSYLQVARKNGKSQWAGAIAVYLLMADGEHGAEIYSSATKRDQAKIVWNASSKMVKQNRHLSQYIRQSRNVLICDKMDSRFEPLSSDAHTLDGLDPHGNIIDEVHAHKTREVWDVLDTAMGARRQPLTWVITTAGTYSPEQIGWLQHEYACDVLDEVFEDDTLFPYICAADDDIPWDSPEAAEQANPNLGISVKPEYINAQRKKAQDQPSFTNAYKRLHTNRWTQSIERWLDFNRWKACGGAMATDAYLRSLPCWAALDLSTKIDMTALALAWWDEPEDLWWLRVQSFLPSEDIERRAHRDKVPYADWARRGFIHLTPGNAIDYKFIVDAVLSANDEWNLQVVAYDPWNAAQTAMELEAEGIETVSMNQGYCTMSEPSKEFERLVVSLKLRHGDNPCLTWQANNITISEDPAGNIKPNKAKGKRRIDGVVAGIMAIGRGLLTGEDISPYKDRGIIVLK